MVHKVYFPSKGTGMYSHSRRLFGKGIGCGVGAVILDGGIGGQSSYPGGIEEYIHTTSKSKSYARKASGEGLGKLSAKLSGLTIKPISSVDKFTKRKPIAFSV